MRIETKLIDLKYLEFLSFYIRTIGSAYFGPNYGRIQEKINDIQERYLETYYKKGKVPRNYKSLEYVMLEEKQSFLPPATRWISKSGRFSCVDLFFFTDDQSYILWDNFRKVVLPILFHDLEGLDEENDTIFCRTMNPIHGHHSASPLHINLEWINLCGYPGSSPDEYPTGIKHSYSYDELMSTAHKGVIYVKNENDLIDFLTQD